jgi:kynurenine formamidase
MHNLVLAELYNAPGAPDIGNDDAVRLCTQYSTQWDGLCHIGSRFDADNDGIEEIVYYNGFRAEDLISSGDDGNSRALALGVENMAVAALQGRGVLVNLHRVYGEQKVLIDYEQMMSVIDSQQIAIEPGDILCLYTGFGDLLLAMKRCPDVGRLRSSFADIDGRDERLLRWITDSNLAAICSDTQAIEIHPENDRRREGGGSLLPLHQHCLFRLGIPLGELWYFQEIAEWLATHNRTSFLLTAPPLRLPGAVGSPVTPIGTV